MPEDQLRRVRKRVNHDFEVMAHEKDEVEGLEGRGAADVREELMFFDVAKEGPLATCFGGKGVEFMDIVNEEASVDKGGDCVVREGDGEGGGCGETDGAGGDGANDVAEAGYIVFALLFGDSSVS